MKWYHYELDPPNSADVRRVRRRPQLFDAVRGAAAPALYASPPTFGAEPAAPTGTAAPVPVKVENLGDAPLNITAVARPGAREPSEPAASAATSRSRARPAPPVRWPRPRRRTNPASSCTVFVRFNPRRAVTTSIARLQFTSNSDAATNRVPLVATSGASISTPIAVGGDRQQPALAGHRRPGELRHVHAGHGA